jgi:hypothetical protein
MLHGPTGPRPVVARRGALLEVAHAELVHPGPVAAGGLVDRARERAGDLDG